MRRGIAFAAITLLAVDCGSSTSPVQPSSAPLASRVIVSGVVREKLPNGNVGLPIPGVLAELVELSDPPVTYSATTDETGRYSLAADAHPNGSGDLPAADLKLSKEGYTGLSTAHLGVLSQDKTFDFNMPPVLRTLAGIISNGEGVPVAGATIEIVTGSNQGRSTSTDVAGNYSFKDVWGNFDLRGSAAGYNSETAHAFINEALAHANLALAAENQLTHSIFTGNLCTVAPPFKQSNCQGASFPYPTEAHHHFVAARAGVLTLSVNYKYVGDYYWNNLTVALTCENDVIAEKRVDLLEDPNPFSLVPPIVQPDGVKGPVQIALSRPCAYDIRLFNYVADRKGGDWTTYRVDAGYPR